jgi:hypothetical protein
MCTEIMADMLEAGVIFDRLIIKNYIHLRRALQTGTPSIQELTL